MSTYNQSITFDLGTQFKCTDIKYIMYENSSIPIVFR